MALNRQLVIYWSDSNGNKTQSRDNIKSSATDPQILAYVNAAIALSNAGCLGYSIEDVLALAATLPTAGVYVSCIDQLKMSYNSEVNSKVVSSIPAIKQATLQPNSLDVNVANADIIAFNAGVLGHMVTATDKAVIEFESGRRKQGKNKRG